MHPLSAVLRSSWSSTTPKIIAGRSCQGLRSTLRTGSSSEWGQHSVWILLSDRSQTFLRAGQPPGRALVMRGSAGWTLTSDPGRSTRCCRRTARESKSRPSEWASRGVKHKRVAAVHTSQSCAAEQIAQADRRHNVGVWNRSLLRRRQLSSIVLGERWRGGEIPWRRARDAAPVLIHGQCHSNTAECVRHAD